MRLFFDFLSESDESVDEADALDEDDEEELDGLDDEEEEYTSEDKLAEEDVSLVLLSPEFPT